MEIELNKITKLASYKDKVYEELKNAILSQRIKPGESLNERLLADSMGVSRTPVREALKMLENDGWVYTEPWKGTFVAEVTQEDVEEVFQLRMVLEPLVIELLKLNSESLQKLDEFYALQSKLGDELKNEDFIKIDRHFHMYLASLTGNKRLISIMENLSDMMILLGITAVRKKNRIQETLREHLSIIKYLKDNDLKNAKEAMIYHVLRTKEQVYDNWEQRG